MFHVLVKRNLCVTVCGLFWGHGYAALPHTPCVWRGYACGIRRAVTFSVVYALRARPTANIKRPYGALAVAPQYGERARVTTRAYLEHGRYAVHSVGVRIKNQKKMTSKCHKIHFLSSSCVYALTHHST